MKISISHCGQAGANGVVFGFLDAANQIDLSLTEDMASYSQPLQVTFHKAIDETPDPLAGILSLCSMAGITRVLTSGGKPTAFEGVAVINEMTRVSAGRIIILAAGKITDENLPELSKHLVTREFHGRRIVGDLCGIQI